MDCPCTVDPVVFTVTESLRACAPDEAAVAAICPRCLTVAAVPDASSPEPDFSRISVAFPDGEGAIALALALGLLDSLALNRSAIESALDAAERAGTDTLLVIDRLIDDPDVEPAIDLERRRDKLESLLY
ncbi:hypothetical protein C479_11670 [Halovivax asiaticus JCM 14624]|uniref:Uncharacterized protein n=1 Tax=Halovivax asiaticus JCM 14624 TaxID=1227490 RepID=M0BIL6_9EURY|nr:DUF6276 family protein [Halovivax asiaticus]ELZ09474.1 hypothetical protein C479_11670 [Halovivax asiaticus JCM 14624]